jgi:hypothetical protein
MSRRTVLSRSDTYFPTRPHLRPAFIKVWVLALFLTLGAHFYVISGITPQTGFEWLERQTLLLDQYVRDDFPVPPYSYKRTVIPVQGSVASDWTSTRNLTRVITVTPPETSILPVPQFPSNIEFSATQNASLADYIDRVVMFNIQNIARLGWLEGAGPTYVDRSQSTTNYNTAIGTKIPDATEGSLLFAGTNATLAQDASNLFWDSTNKHLGVGDATPVAQITVGSDASAAYANGIGDLYVQNDLEVGGTIYGNVAGAINPNLTTGSILFQGASGISEDNANFFWDDTNDRLGIGTVTPRGPLDIVGDDLYLTNPTAGQSIILESYRNSAFTHTQILGRAARGTQDAPLAINSGNDIFYITTQGYDGTDFGVATEAMTVKAAETFTPTAQGTRILFSTTDAGAITNAYRMVINEYGNVGIGTTGPSSRLHVLSTTEQLRVSYNATNYYSTIVGATGVTTFDAVK